ncbi:MAG: hypothetical protein ACHP85_01215, partial [Burkholderiales bacterium]
MTRRALAFACAGVLAGPGGGRALAQDAQPPSFKTGSEVVVLDVVIRDKKGRTVRDVRPDELVVLEEGVPQQILALRLRATGEPEEAPGAEPAPAVPAERGAPAPRDVDARHVNLVTLVYDQLGVDGRANARKAGLALAGLTEQNDLLVSVFTIRNTLGLVQQFTTDRAQVERAVREATGTLDTQYVNATEMLQRAVEQEAVLRR